VIDYASEGLRTFPLQVGNLLQSPVQHSISAIMPNDKMRSRERKSRLCKDRSQSIHDDAYCVKDELCLPRCLKEGAEDESAMDDDNYQNKQQIIRHFCRFNGVNDFFFRGECQTMGQSHVIVFFRNLVWHVLNCNMKEKIYPETSKMQQMVFKGMMKAKQANQKGAFIDTGSTPTND
jgi:hypothetical protein